MRISPILTSILHEPWMILPSAAEAHLPMIAAWLQGQEIKFDEKPKLSVGMASMAAVGRISPGYMEDIADFPADTVAIVNLKGELTKYDGWCHYGATSISGLIKTLAVSKNVIGCVLDTDGPGGGVNAISPLIEAIQFFKSQNKPIVTHADLIASAHYYVGIHTDSLFLDNGLASQAGSIGTLIQFADYSKYWEEKGINLRTIYAPESTHKNQPWEEARKGNDEPMKNQVLSPLARRFQSAVRACRGSKLNLEVEGLLNGAMFFGEDAVDYGLADQIGTLGEAVQRVFDLVEIRKFMSK